MKTPSLLLGAGLLFWGWQTGHLVEGAVMAAVLEGAHLVKTRWDFTDQDFRRIWTFCALLLFAAALFAFTSTGGPGEFRDFFQNPNPGTGRNASTASARTVASLVRWLPMMFFLFLAAQAYSSREGIPPETISVILRVRWQKARRLGQALPAARSVNVSYPYFILCLFSASFHSSEDGTFYAGLCLLVAWALWPHRSRRFGAAAWAGVLAVAVLLGYGGQRSAWRLYRLLEGYNAQWFIRRTGGSSDPMQSRTMLGKIGWLKGSGQIVIRLEPKEGNRAPALLREASYRTWRGQTWYADIPREKFERILDADHPSTWVLVPDKTNSAAVNIACYLPGGLGLLPLPPRSGQLENLSAFGLEKSALGAVLAEGPGLVVFDALYGPGPSTDSPPDRELDTYVLPREKPALDEVIERLQLRQQGRREVLHTLSEFFQDTNNFRYSTWQGYDKTKNTNESAVARFLLRTHSGHCEYFATATVLLLRELGIPARYAVGYAVHEASGQKYVVRQRDAHAWCLVGNLANNTWQDFDTTPASWVGAEAGLASRLQFLSDCWSRVVFEITRFRWGQTHLRQYLLWGVTPVLAVLLYQIIFRSRRRRHRGKPGEAASRVPWPGLDSEFYQVERKLMERGVARQPGELLSAWLLRATRDPTLASMTARLQELLDLHYRYRFDPLGLSEADRQTLRRLSDGCLASMK